LRFLGRGKQVRVVVIVTIVAQETINAMKTKMLKNMNKPFLPTLSKGSIMPARQERRDSN
jgi:hypothetical protein